MLLASCAKQPIIQDIDSNGVWNKITEQKGEKIVLVNFWATWCAPCVEEIPALLKLQEIYKNDLTVIFVSFDFDRKSTLHFVEKKGWDMRSYFNAESDKTFLANMPDEWSGAMPFTMVYNKDGSILEYLTTKESYEYFDSIIKKSINNQ